MPTQITENYNEKLPCNWKKKKAQGHSGFLSDVKNVAVGQTQLKFSSEKTKHRETKIWSRKNTLRIIIFIWINYFYKKNRGKSW